MNTYPVVTRQMPAVPLLVVRRQAALQELSTVVPAACGLVWKAIRDHNIPGAGKLVAVYLDDQIHLEVGAEMLTPVAGIGEVVPSTTPAGLAATTTHRGPYRLLPAAHQAVRQWCADHHHALAGPNWEVYGHGTDDESQITTDIFYLLKG